MSAAGTPSTDPWVILARERARYEEQFKSLKPINGIVTGEQAKGFFLQSQLPPLVLGQIWALADTDSDGKMDINEFSIACKLINLKLRGFEIPKMLPPSLLASATGMSQPLPTVPTIPPLPNAALIGAPPKPEPPKIPPMVPQPPVSVPPLMPAAALPPVGGVPTGMVPAMPMVVGQRSVVPQPMAPIQPIPPIQPMASAAGMTSLISRASPLIAGTTVAPLASGVSNSTFMTGISSAPLLSGASSTPLMTSGTSIMSGVSGTTMMSGLSGSSMMSGVSVAPLIPGVSSVSSMMTAASGSTMSGVSAPMVPGVSASMVTGVSAPMVPGVSAPMVPGVAPPLIGGVSAPILPGAGVQSIVSSVMTAATSTMSPVASVTSTAVGPGATSTPRASVTSLERATSIESPQVDWAVPQPIKLKYTQIFNTTDRTRSGYLSGAQARNVMVQTKLPQSILAQIWALSDMDSDGRLGCEEFVLAMHLCEQASLGHAPPAKLPLELIPPSFRKTRSSSRTASVSSQGSGTHDVDPASTLIQTSFEDKRKENFEKGQAELERRRKTLLDQQRKEAEERERKEREEQERKEKARQEAERKRLEELEKQMREQQEQERLKEEERKRQAEQREIARKEMERQRQLEWEKQRLQELQQQRQREQENVLKLKAKNQSLSIELSTLNEQVKELSQKICDTRVGVSNYKSTIDGMRTTRDAQMQELSQLKNKLKEQNARLLALSQEKIKLEAKNKMNAQLNGQDAEQARLAFENKEITIKNLREKVNDMQKEIDNKLVDIENNNSQLNDLKSQMSQLISECEKLYGVYEQKKDKVLEMKNSNKNIDYSAAWKDNDWANTETSEWPVEDTWQPNATQPPTDTQSGVVKYRALYEFVARNADEISFQPGDIINVPTTQTGEPGWLAGEIRGHTGWFPESYVEPLDGVGLAQTEGAYTEIQESKPLEGIAEVPEVTEVVQPDVAVAAVAAVAVAATEPAADMEPEQYLANYPYQSQEQGDLTFNAGDVITVIKKDGDWWTGKLNGVVGIFPSNYVQKVENQEGAPLQSSVSAAETAQVDNEVSQINTISTNGKPLDSVAMSNAQVVKGKKPEIASVIAPYQATSNEQLSLSRGQLIMIRKKTDSGWWEGELQAKGRKRQVGWFPASYVKVLNSSGRASGRTTPVSTTRMQQEVVIDKVIALFPYTAGNPDELSFAKDDIISVTAREEEAWWRGELNGVSGLFPSNYVTPLQQYFSSGGRVGAIVAPDVNSNNKQRYDCIKELVQTERAYVEDMNIVHEVFEKPLRQNKIIPKKDIDAIFLNCQEVIQSNKNFLKDLTYRYDNGYDIIGDIFTTHLPNMTAYITFCSKQLDAATHLQKLTETCTAFKDFMKRCQLNPDTKGMPLSSYLLKPMQRITKYPLLISKILDNTPLEHKDYNLLKESLQVAEGFLSCINENIRVKENIDRMEWLQECVQNDSNILFNSTTNKLGPRKLIHYGTFTKVKNGKELLGFLFNDFFIMVQPSKSVGTQFNFQKNNSSFKMYKQPILIQNMLVSRGSTDSVEAGTDSNRVLKIADSQSKYTISLLAPSVNECNTWTKKIETAKEIYSKICSVETQEPKIMSSNQLYLDVHVQGANELTKLRYGRLKRKVGKSYTENVYCKVTLADQEKRTGMAKETLKNPNVSNVSPPVPSFVWDCSMQFLIRDIEQDVITFSVYELNAFTPDEFLGKAELKVLDILKESQKVNGPMKKRIILHHVESGELLVKLDVCMFE